jgi:hypothetical protein
VTSQPTDDLLAENAELRRRVEAAEREIAQLRAEALERRAEIRSMAEALPSAISRHALVWGMIREAKDHPDKAGVVRRAIRKLGRAPRKALRVVTRSPR